MRKLIYLLSAVAIIVSCRKEENQTPSFQQKELSAIEKVLFIPESPFRYDLYGLNDEGNSLTVHNNTPAENRTTPWGATLGRVLFYDKQLSKNNTISCSSCHLQKFGFSDSAIFSTGFEGKKTERHSMGLANARYYSNGRFFWDERATSLEEQVLMPIQDAIEMGMHLDTLLPKLQALAYYPPLFQKAFSTEEISSELIAKALAQFVRSIVSSKSKFDNGLALVNNNPKTSFPNFTEEENNGKNIFFNHDSINCSGCHSTRLFIGISPRNNGVRNGDFGASNTYLDSRFNGAFKMPSLVNIAVRPPYMHDGSLASLEEVVEHYNSGLNNDDGNLDPHLQGPSRKGLQMNLTTQEKVDLVKFLETLTDETLLNNASLANPFK
jgi:cytochrome c peroxidase